MARETAPKPEVRSRAESRHRLAKLLAWLQKEVEVREEHGTFGEVTIRVNFKDGLVEQVRYNPEVIDR